MPLMQLFYKIWNGLKVHWDITSDKQAARIWAAFACTGFSMLVVRYFINLLLEISFDTPLWIHILLIVFVVWPIFNILLLFYGLIFNEFQFFLNFQKKILIKIKKKIFCK